MLRSEATKHLGAKRRSISRLNDRPLDAIGRIERLGQLRTAYQERLLQVVDVLFERVS